jgi:hypothetical protein
VEESGKEEEYPIIKVTRKRSFSLFLFLSWLTLQSNARKEEKKTQFRKGF